MRWADCSQVELVHSELARSWQTSVLMVWTFFLWFGLCTSQSRLERFSRFASATGKMSLISALMYLMKTCRF